MSAQNSNNQEPYLIDLPSNGDDRGVLTSIEATNDIPIEILRIFYMHHMTADRGGHGHIDTDQVVVAVHGAATFKLICRDGSECNYRLDDPCKGLYMPRLTFADICELTEDAVCLVLANTHYNMSMSLRNIEDYRNYMAEHRDSIARGDDLNG